MRSVLFGLLMALGAGVPAFPEDGPSKVVVAPEAEPGERLEVAGTVFRADGRTPLSGAKVYVYQTDAKGFYRPGTNSSENPRLKGTIVTDGAGRYSFRTIKPGPYPGGGVPAHIHYVVSAPGHHERRFEIVFEGDPALTGRIREEARQEDSAFSLRPLERGSDGQWGVVQDVRLRPE